MTRTIIGCALEVHAMLGPGLLESAYEACLTFELIKAGLLVERQKPVTVVYKEISLECGYRIDILVENTVIIELKALESLNEVHEAQILTHMRFAGKPIELLMNFNVKLLKHGLRRFVM